MHIPDGFLSPPVWATLDAAAVPAIALAARRAQRELESPDDRRIPLLGVMGAFVFAAQMINFPVGLGTSGHLVGAALLAIAVGPAAAAIALTAILILQAFIFQDGGVIALGANTFNMCVAGVIAGYLPYRLWGRGRTRSVAIFLAGLLSVIASGWLALAELLISGVPMPRPLLLGSLGLFVISGLIEGAITVTVVHAIERLNPAWIRQAKGFAWHAAGGILVLVMMLVGVGVASAAPDAIENLTRHAGLLAAPVWHAPMAQYQAAMLGPAWIRKALAGLVGLCLIWGACALLGRKIARPRSA